MCEGPSDEVVDDARVVDDLLELGSGHLSLARLQVGFAANIDGIKISQENDTVRDEPADRAEILGRDQLPLCEHKRSQPQPAPLSKAGGEARPPCRFIRRLQFSSSSRCNCCTRIRC